MAYGENRTSVATDTFDTEISANWDNGPADWGTLAFVAGGHISPTSSATDAAIRWNANSFNSNQYSKVTVQAHTSGGTSAIIGATVRMAAGSTDESSYLGYAEQAQYSIYEVDSVFGFGLLASSADASLPMTVGETLTIEVEGTNFRLGSSASGSDIEELTSSDGTISSGIAGVTLYENGANAEVTAWEGGDIGQAPLSLIDPAAAVF